MLSCTGPSNKLIAPFPRASVYKTRNSSTFLLLNQRTKVESRQRICRRLHHHRIAKSQGAQYRQVHFQKLRKEFALYDVANISSTTLLPIIKPFAQLLR
jgi:hypothetical protein